MDKHSIYRHIALFIMLIMFVQFPIHLDKQSKSSPAAIYHFRHFEENRTESLKFIGPTLKTAENKEKTAYLTFDDGPSPNTESILNILRRYGIHATFFVKGKDSPEAQRLYYLIDKEGHVIGNHTYSHNYSSLYTSVHAFMNDTQQLNILLEKVTGKKPTLLRFPGGSNNQLCLHYGGAKTMNAIIEKILKEGYDYTDWNVSSTDAASAVQPKDDIINAVLNASKNKQKAIILMHDVKAKITTVQALPEIIEGLMKQGFKFDVLDREKFLFKFKHL